PPDIYSCIPFFFLTTRPPPTSTLFPYTTLFRSLLLDYPIAFGALGLAGFFQRKHWGKLLQLRPSMSKMLPIMGVIVAISARFLLDRKSTRLNSSHGSISYAVFCLKKKNNKKHVA